MQRCALDTFTKYAVTNYLLTPVFLKSNLEKLDDIGDPNFVKKFKDDLLPVVGGWTTISISQEESGPKYIYMISLGGQNVAIVQNTQPEQFDNVGVYVSEPWAQPQAGYVRNIVIQIKA